MSKEINLVQTSLTLPLPKNTWLEKIKDTLRYLGPAFIVSVAYIDPGNFATNISAGSNFNYNLVWVVLWSNLMAIFLQTLSAKLGIVTGVDLATQCGRVFSRPVNLLLWIIMLFAVIATYMAEFLGSTLGLYLLFGIPLVAAGLITVCLTFVIVYLRRFGQHMVERIIISLVAVIGASYCLELFLAKPDWHAVALHTLVPSLGPESILVAVGMLGATVMPHVIYLHSDLMKARRTSDDLAEAKKHFRMECLDIAFAMNIAFLVNAAMVIIAAAVFFNQGPVDSIEQAHKSLAPLLGSLSSGAFGLALLASGLSSSTVGAMAGECMLKGFIGLDIPVNIRRAITMIPAIILLWLGFNPMKMLIMSQVTLSFALPAAVIPLLLITKRRDIMGEMTNRKITNAAGVVIVSLIVSLNVVLLYLTFSA
ncbi:MULTISPECIES: Nramp family divalent metal transporter [Dehalobacter]|jgi:manganese transport protein|uniref:Mn(2+) uptake NRAMP transporter MntH n=2 Tax=Dehalobacter restrictus TaxID=55583 RepID=A0A857DIM4_9FIRM|nr:MULTISPECIES: Nramp family divalent metal transporter [Dehalobacter]AHF09466.1 manganese transporter [Dehalobacter restrictus DSM 9455]MCG1026012.1 Nramp family divalent metal transporter [Dehalobacter sp.]OCZ53214.1 divalent metal cation transporter [Dehalobacter sp. TeCB1]QHA00056.1 Mn(2+) uptake NRAMP transporter MntH [Dehalobacter restrictus]